MAQMQQLQRELTPEEIAKAVRREKLIKGGKTFLMVIIAVGAGALAYKLIEDNFGKEAEVPSVTPDAGAEALGSLGIANTANIGWE